MARLAVADGVEVAACTPHILPGVYHNTGPQILAATNALRRAVADAGIRLELINGADAHMTPAFVSKLDAGEILTLGQSRYVLIELPRHVAPIRMEAFFFDILDAGYVPILTHPERLIWICDRYTMIERLAFSGVWMQITAGSLTGRFGSRARYWAERMLAEGIVHILASDAHDAQSVSVTYHLADLIGATERRRAVNFTSRAAALRKMAKQKIHIKSRLNR